MEKRVIFYARVSNKDQNLARQLEAFRAAGAGDEDIIYDVSTGANMDRPEYQALKSKLGLRSGDVLIVKELDRLGRNKEAIKEELQYWKNKGVGVKILDIPTTMIDIPVGQEWILDMINTILIEVLASMAQQERENIRKRQIEGVAAMPIINGKRVSARTHRPAGNQPLKKPEEWDVYYKRWCHEELSAAQCAREMKISKSSFYRLARKEKEENRG